MKKCIFAKEEKKSCMEFSLNQLEIRLKLNQQKRHFETKMKMIIKIFYWLLIVIEKFI